MRRTCSGTRSCRCRARGPASRRSSDAAARPAELQGDAGGQVGDALGVARGRRARARRSRGRLARRLADALPAQRGSARGCGGDAARGWEPVDHLCPAVPRRAANVGSISGQFAVNDGISARRPLPPTRHPSAADRPPPRGPGRGAAGVRPAHSAATVRGRSRRGRRSRRRATPGARPRRPRPRGEGLVVEPQQPAAGVLRTSTSRVPSARWEMTSERRAPSVDDAAGVADHVRVARRQPEHGERVDARVHAGQHGQRQPRRAPPGRCPARPPRGQGRVDRAVAVAGQVERSAQGEDPDRDDGERGGPAAREQRPRRRGGEHGAAEDEPRHPPDLVLLGAGRSRSPGTRAGESAVPPPVASM